MGDPDKPWMIAFICLCGINVLICIIIACYRAEKRKKKSGRKQSKVESPGSVGKKDAATSPIVTRSRSNDGEKRNHSCGHSKYCSRKPSNVNIEHEKNAPDVFQRSPKRATSPTSHASNSQPEVHSKIIDESAKSTSLKIEKTKQSIGASAVTDIRRSMLDHPSGYVCMKGASPTKPKNEEKISFTKFDDDALRFNFDQPEEMLDEDGYLIAKTFQASGSQNSLTSGSTSSIRIQECLLEDIPEELSTSQESLYVDGNSLFDKNIVITP